MRAAIYLRLSKEDKQESIENQRALLRKYANDHGFSVVKEYTDEAISGLRRVFERLADRFQRYDPPRQST